MPLTVTDFGPFTGGVIDGANPSLNMSGSARYIRNAVLSGKGRLSAGRGSEVAITLMNDAGTPAACTSVQLIQAFGDGCLAVAHSTATSKVYLYRLDAALTGWYNLAGTFTASATATPLATALWTGLAAPVSVTIAEVLGTAYIATLAAASAGSLNYATRKYNGATITDLTAMLGTGVANPVYFLGVFTFHGHLWGWGYDKDTVAATAFRPELLRHGGPDGGSLDADGNGSFTVGHRIKSAREAVIGVTVAGDVAYVGTSYSIWPIVGYGRDTWDKSHPLDDSYGFIGLHGAVSANGACYYWSPRGPARVVGLNKPEPLWDALASTAPNVIDPHRIQAAFDVDTDQVLWFYRAGSSAGNQLLAAYDIRRNVFVGPDTDVGIQVGCAGLVAPIAVPDALSSVTAPGPTGPPTIVSTTGISATIATADWSNSDTTNGVYTELELRQVGTVSWVSYDVAAGLSRTLFAIQPGITYEWHIRNVKNGVTTAWVGPNAASTFTTPAAAVPASLNPPTGLTITNRGPGAQPEILVQWTNSGDTGVSTEVYLQTGTAGTFDLSATIVAPASSVLFKVSRSDTYAVTARHVKSGFTGSNTAGPASSVIDLAPAGTPATA